MAIAFQLMIGPAAQAGTVSMIYTDDGPGLLFSASPGETNQVTIQELGSGSTFPFGSSWLVSDKRAAITAGAFCVAIDEHTAGCTDPGDAGSIAQLYLGDGDDTFRPLPPAGATFPELQYTVDGGPGADRLHGGPSGDELRGGPGRDRLSGGRYDDVLRGGGGHDRLQGQDGNDVLVDGERNAAGSAARPDADRFDGGRGADTVSYHQRLSPVRVDLGDGRPDGAAREGDVLVAVESVVGGHGADRLAGDDGPNTLDGRDGRDRLIGRGGDDSLWFGGALTSCGAGSDQAGAARKFGSAPPRRQWELEDLAPDCETTAFGDPLPAFPAYPTHLHGRVMSYTVSCPAYYDYEEEADITLVCSGAVVLKRAYGHHLLLARGTFPRGPWHNRPVRVRLTRLGRRLAQRPHGVKALLEVRADRRWFPLTWMIRLKSPASTPSVPSAGAP